MMVKSNASNAVKRVFRVRLLILHWLVHVLFSSPGFSYSELLSKEARGRRPVVSKVLFLVAWRASNFAAHSFFLTAAPVAAVEEEKVGVFASLTAQPRWRKSSAALVMLGHCSSRNPPRIWSSHNVGNDASRAQDWHRSEEQASLCFWIRSWTMSPKTFS